MKSGLKSAGTYTINLDIGVNRTRYSRSGIIRITSNGETDTHSIFQYG